MIRNLIFDVGDVLLEYRWQEMFRDYGIPPEEGRRIGREIFDTEIWSRGLDAGLLSTQEAIDEYEKLFPEDIEEIGWFLHHGEDMVVPRPEVWDKVRSLKEKGYRIYLLSNYSEELFQAHTQGAAFLDVLDGGVVSYQVHVTKPDSRIYQILMEKYGLRPEECVFFDDRPENVKGAQAQGICALQVTSRQMINETLQNMIDGMSAEMLLDMSGAAPEGFD